MADIMVTLQKLANQNTAKTFDFNSKEAEKSRSWQSSMSNTAHQREVQDLVKAGLNPVLSANSGAQSYTTSSAQGTADSAVNAMGNVQSSRNSAAAQRYAADRSLQASRAMASAQMYSANMQYEAQKFAAMHKSLDNYLSNFTSRRNTKTKAETDKWIAQNKQAQNAYGLLDKYVGNPNVVASSYKSWINSKHDIMFNDRSRLDLSPQNASRITGSVTKSFRNSIAKALTNNGYVASDWNIAVIINAMSKGKYVNFSKLIRKGDHTNSARSMSFF